MAMLANLLVGIDNRIYVGMIVSTPAPGSRSAPTELSKNNKCPLES
jgi:hypothetical protein